MSTEERGAVGTGLGVVQEEAGGGLKEVFVGTMGGRVMGAGKEGGGEGSVGEEGGCDVALVAGSGFGV